MWTAFESFNANLIPFLIVKLWSFRYLRNVGNSFGAKIFAKWMRKIPKNDVIWLMSVFSKNFHANQKGSSALADEPKNPAKENFYGVVVQSE